LNFSLDFIIDNKYVLYPKFLLFIIDNNMFFVRRPSLYFSLANVIITNRATEWASILFTRRIIDRIFLLNFKIPLLSTSDVVGVVHETVLELARSRLSGFGHLFLTLGQVGSVSHSGGLLLLNLGEVGLFHSLQFHFVLVALGSVVRGATHLVEGINIPLRVFQELVNVLTKHLFKVAILHTDLARLFSLLASNHGNLLLLSVASGGAHVFSEVSFSLLAGSGSSAVSRSFISVETVVNGALTVGIEASNLVS
jgi:hypothetical protein